MTPSRSSPLPVRSGAWIAAAVAGGVLLRLRQFLEFPSLWFDEAMLAVNIVERPLRGLFLPLEYDQGAPVGFLLLQKACVGVFGPWDTALRFVPLACSMAALLLFARVAFAWLGRGALVAVALMAVSAPLVDYAIEAKQYSSDVLCTVLMWWFVQPSIDGRATPRDLLGLAVAGAGAVVLSHPAVFVLPGVGAVAAWDCWRRRDRRRLAALVGALVLWTTVLAILHAISWKGLAANAKLVEYWKAWFLPWEHGAMAWWPWLSWALDRALAEAAGLAPAAPIALLAAVGASVLLREHPRVAVVVLLPVPVVLAASALHLYPFAQRLLLFAAPVAFVLVAAGVDALAAASGRFGRRLGAPVLALLALANPVVSAAAQAWRPPEGEHLRPALDYLLAHRQAGDGVYVYYGAKPAFRFYAHSRRFDPDGLLLGRAHRGDPPAYLAELEPLRSRARAWIVFAHACPNCPVDEKAYLLGALDRMGTRVDAFGNAGATVSLYAFPGPRSDGGRGG